MTVSDTPASIDWVREDQWFKAMFAKRLNRVLLLHVVSMAEVFQRRIAATVDASTVEWVRDDLVTMSRWSARTRITREAFQRAYDAIQIGIGTLLTVAAPVLLASDGPLWLQLVFVGTTAALALGLDLETSVFNAKQLRTSWQELPEAVRTTTKGAELAPRDDEGRPAFTRLIGNWSVLLAALGSLITLVWVWPAPPRTAWATVGILLLTALAIALVTALWHKIISQNTTIRSATIVLTIVLLAGYGQWWLLAKVDRADWRYGPEFGALLGTSIGAVLAALQLGLPLITARQTIRKFRGHSEQEFVQAAMQALASVDPDGPNRPQVVRDVEYLAGVLDRGIAGQLRREDPASAADIADRLGARAAALRACKRDVLLGKPGALEELRTALDSAAVIGARREWMALPADAEWASAERPRLVARAARLAVRVLIFLLPFAIGAVVALVGDAPVAGWLPAAVPFALGWVAVNLAELITPGSGRGVADAAAGTEMFGKRLRGQNR